VHIDIYVALAGLIVGCAVGLTGMGGGSLMTPILVLLFGVQPLAAVSSDLVASMIMKPVGAAVHARRRTVNWRLVTLLAAGSVPCAFLGVAFLRLLGRAAMIQTVVQLALGTVLLLCVAAVLARGLVERRRRFTDLAARSRPLRIRPLRTIALGGVIGFVLGITSTGSGTLIIVLLLLLYPQLRGSEMVGTDLTQAVPMVAAAAVAHILFGDFKLGLTLSIVAGSIPGVLIGSLLSSRARTGFIRGVLCFVLLVSGLKLVGASTLAIGIVMAFGLFGVTASPLLRAVLARLGRITLAGTGDASRVLAPPLIQLEGTPLLALSGMPEHEWQAPAGLNSE